MSAEPGNEFAKVEPLGTGERPRPISQSLARLVAELEAEFPKAREITFDFTDYLRLHIDLRTKEEAQVALARLPALAGGIYSDIFVGSSPRHPFWQRVSAKVDA